MLLVQGSVCAGLISGLWVSLVGGNGTQRSEFESWSDLVCTVVRLSPPTSEAGGSNPGPYVGKLVVTCGWSLFTAQNLDQLYILVSPVLLTTRHNITIKVLGVMSNIK